VPSKQTITDGVYVSLPELIALRAQAKRQRWFANTTSQTTRPGEQRSRDRGRGIEFDEIRPYLPGDDIRRIDWRTSARKGTPYTKLFTEEREQSVYLAIDQRASLFFGSAKRFKSVMAAQVAALIGWSAVSCGYRVSGVVIGQSITTSSARASQRALLQLLNAITDANQQLSAQSSDNFSLSQLFDECIARAHRGSTVVVISDFSDWNDYTAQLLQKLVQQRTVRLVRIIDALEDTLPRTAIVNISDGRARTTVALNSATQAKHQSRRRKLAEGLHHDCQRFGVNLSVLYTHDDLLKCMESCS